MPPQAAWQRMATETGAHPRGLDGYLDGREAVPVPPASDADLASTVAWAADTAGRWNALRHVQKKPRHGI